MVTIKKAYVVDGSMHYFKQVGSLHILQDPIKVNMLIEVDGKKHVFAMRFENGFACDGLSVPKPLRWFLPSWDKKNGNYNLAGVVHDALYGNAGFDRFTREECDDIFRGLLRESGISRFKAGCADKAVGWFANKHFGSDDLKVAHLAKMVV